MKTLGFIFIGFGILVIIWPELIAYMLAFFVITMGLNLIALAYRIEKNQSKKQESSFSFGGYEIIKKKK